MYSHQKIPAPFCSTPHRHVPENHPPKEKQPVQKETSFIKATEEDFIPCASAQKDVSSLALLLFGLCFFQPAIKKGDDGETSA